MMKQLLDVDDEVDVWIERGTTQTPQDETSQKDILKFEPISEPSYCAENNSEDHAATSESTVECNNCSCNDLLKRVL